MRHVLFATALALLLSPLAGAAQTAILTRAINMRSRGIPTGNYSGITRLGGQRYALVSDKESHGGFRVVDIAIDSVRGRILSLADRGYRSTATNAARDEEGICYYPATHTLFVSAEDDQQIVEYDTLGRRTGRQMELPAMFGTSNITHNFGFEALTYSAADSAFYTVTERPLLSDKSDGELPLRILRIGSDLRYAAQYAYRMEPPALRTNVKYYAHGVSEMTVLPDGRLIVMERELSIPSGYLGALCRIRLFVVRPEPSALILATDTLSHLPRDRFLSKTAIADFTTHLNTTSWDYANYEGMCPGPTLSDGRATLLLVCDSQAAAGNSLYRLRDYIRLVILPAGL